MARLLNGLVILSINDHKNSEVRVFTYDDLDRLTNENIAGTNQATVYEATSGRISSRGGLSYTYDGSHYHAAASYNSYTYTYDGNGNATARARNGVTLTFAYNGENRLTTVNSSDNSVNNSYTYDADGTRIKSANVYQNLAPGAWVYSNSTLSNNYVGADGDTYPNSGSGSSREFVNGTSGILQRYQLDLGRNYLIDKIKVWHYFPDSRTYHDTKIEIVPSGSSTWTAVFDSDQSGEYAESASGKTVTFTAQNVRGIRDWINGSTADTGNHWVELEVWGWSNIYYVNKYYEYRGHHVQSSRCYYFGDQRIAMRRGGANCRPRRGQRSPAHRAALQRLGRRPPGLRQHSDIAALHRSARRRGDRQPV